MHDVLRIIDANLNRANEGLRTLEEFARMVLNDANLTEQIKQLRHELAAASAGFDQSALLAARDTLGDVGTGITNESEQTRGTAADIAAAACKRVAESLRCIEEYGKLISPDVSARFKQIRYQMYTTEQGTMLMARRCMNISEVRLHVLITESLCRLSWLETCRQIIAANDAIRDRTRVAAGSRGKKTAPRLAIQLREKNLPDRELVDRARTLRTLTQDSGVMLIINDRPDVTRLANADGLHLGQDDLSTGDARLVLGSNMVFGKSTHSLEQFRDAMYKEAPDYIAVGPMFPSKTKPADQIPGPSLLHAALETSIRPVVAIGGITLENLSLLKKSQPFAIAVSQAIIAAEDPKRATEEFLSALLK